MTTEAKTRKIWSFIRSASQRGNRPPTEGMLKTPEVKRYEKQLMEREKFEALDFTQFLTREQSKQYFDYDIPEGWEALWGEGDEEGSYYIRQYRLPTGETAFAEDVYQLESGEWITKAQLEAMQPPEQPKKYASPELVQELKNYGVDYLTSKIVTEDIWLSPEQARELGIQTSEDLLIPVSGKGEETPLQYTGEVAPTLIKTDEENLYQEYVRIGGQLNPIDWYYAGQPLRPGEEISVEEQQQAVISDWDEMFSAVYPELGLARPPVEGEVGGVPYELGSEGIIEWAMQSDDNLAQLVSDIGRVGRNDTTERLIRNIFPTATESEINSVFGIVTPVAEEALKGAIIIKDEQARETLKAGGVAEEDINKIIEASHLDLSKEELDRIWEEQFSEAGWMEKNIWSSLMWRSITAGYGDLTAAASGAAGALGAEGVRDNLLNVAEKLQQAGPPMQPWQGPESLVDPRFWLTTMTRVGTFSMAMLPVAVATGGLGYLAAGGLGAGATGATITAVITGGIGSGLTEAGLESGDAYNQAIAMGFSQEEATDAARSVFNKNAAFLVGTNILEFGLGFVNPTGILTRMSEKGLVRLTIKGGRIVGGALTEGGQEYLQDIFQRQALGLPVEWDEEAQMAVIIGGLMGSGTVALGVLTEITDNTKAQFTPEQNITFNEKVSENLASGLNQEQAEQQAMDFMVENDKEVKANLEKNTEEAIRNEVIKEIKSEDKVEQFAWDYLSKAEEVTGEARIEQTRIETLQNEITRLNTEITASQGEKRLALEEELRQTQKELADIRRKQSRVKVGGFETIDRYKPVLEISIHQTPYLDVNGYLSNPNIAHNIKASELIGQPNINRYMEETGNIRVTGEKESVSIELQYIPTDQQLNSMKIIIGDKKVNYDITDIKGNVLESGIVNSYNEFIADINKLENLKSFTEVPTTEPGMPEAGYQPAMIEGVVEKIVRPKGKGIVTQISMDEQLKLNQARKQEIDNLLAKKGRLPAGEGTKEQLRLESAEIEAKQELSTVELVEELESRIEEIEQELDARRAPYHGGVKAGPYAGYTSKQLDRMLQIYYEARSEYYKTKVPPAEEPLFVTEPMFAETDEVLPDPGSSASKLFERIQFEQPTEDFKNKFQKGLQQFNTKMLDDLYPLRKFTEQFTKGGVNLSIEENPYLLARLLKGITSKANVFLEQGTFGKTFWKMEKGKAVPNFTGESLENILKEVKQPKDWMDFSVYLVARRSFELSQRNIETGIDYEDALNTVEELEEKHPDFDNLANRVYKYQDNLLNYANETGLISNELMGKLKKYGNYVPFYRVFNELQSKGLMGKKMANIAQPIKKIKGSEREIINPLESIIKNTYVIINSADRNQIGVMMANLVDQNPELSSAFERVKTPIARVAGVTAKELGVEIEGLSEADSEAVVDIFRPSFFTRGDEVTVLIDGKKQYYKVDPDLRNALLNLEQEHMGLLHKILSYPAKWLRAGATLNPDFMVRNPARDQLSAFAYSNYGFLPGIDFMRGVASILTKDADYQLFRASGAEHSMLVSMDREYLQKTFKEIVQGKRFTEYVKHPLELFQIISELGEKATRLGEFKAGIKRGAMPLEAGYAARNVTLDFSQAGTAARAVNSLIAFFNSNVRGWGKMVSSFKEHPVRTSSKVFIGITLPSILLYYANRDDPRWDEIPQWQKDLFWIVFVGDKIIRIPKPFELGILFGSVPERFCEWLDKKDPELMKESGKSIVEAGMPGFMPTALLPIIENITDYSFFRQRSIVPQSRQNMPPELQYGDYTSEFSRELGELLGYSPAKIDNLIYGWSGGLGRYATDILDGILVKTGISPDIPEPSPTLADIPVIKSFVVRNPYGSSGKSVDDFYKKLEEYQEGEKYLKEMIKIGETEKYESYKASHPELLFYYDYESGESYSASARFLRQIAGQLTELGKKEDEVYQSKTLTPEEKRAKIDEIAKLKTEVARRGLDLLLGEENIIEARIEESVNKLGEVIEESPEISLEKPDIYDMKNLRNDFRYSVQFISKEELDKIENVDPLAYSYLELKDAESKIEGYLNKPIYKYEVDLAEGYTFQDYYKQWQAGVIKDEFLDSLSRRDLELLKEYQGLSDEQRKEFLEAHPELKLNPRDEWLKTHPKENALLAVWGQAKILTLESYNEFKKLVKELDIPESAIPKLTLPPEGSVESYFKYYELGEEYGYNSAKVKQLIAEDDALREWLGREVIETSPKVLELQVKLRDLEEDSPEYQEIQRRIDAYNLELPEELIDTYVEWYSTQRSGYEDDWYLMEHPDFYNAMVENGQWQERNFSKVPTRKVYSLYEKYQSIEDRKEKLVFRHENPELETWLVDTQGYTPVGDRWE